MKDKKCRFCNSTLTKTFVDLGMAPLSNSFLTHNQLNNEEPVYPLHVFVCDQCFLVQIEEFEKPEKIFSDYAYFSSYSDTWLSHAREYADNMIKKFNLNYNSQVIEIASNDGYLLQYFKMKEIPVLGIEPATNVAEVAIKRGIPTITKFFGSDVANELIHSGIKADLLIGNNVLAHVPNLNDFVNGLKILLESEGIITIEFPHLLKLIEQNQFDTIYHEHFSYFSFLVAQKVFIKNGLRIFDVEEISTHGGSLRIYASHVNSKWSPTRNVENLINKEKKFGLEDISTYNNFGIKVKKIRKDLIDFVTKAKKEGKKIVGYGAAAKGNMLLNYCKIGQEFIEYVVDRNPHKQGTYLPGTHINIKDPDQIRYTKPDYVLILPWNLKDEIISQMNYIHSWGGKFVTPIPEVKIY